MTKLKKYQQQGVRRIGEFNGRALLADDMGLGKSIQSLCYVYRNELWPAIVVCPATLKWNWEAEAIKHYNLRSEILEGRKPRKLGISKPPPLLIINYEILGYWLDYLIQINPQAVIIDECHRAKNRKSQTYQNVRDLCRGGRKKEGVRRKSIKNVIALSGTPLTNRPAELWTTLNIIRPKTFGSFWTFASNYCNIKWTPWGRDFTGASNIKKLHKKLNRTVMIRRLKKDVLKELPSKSRHIVPIPIQKPQEYLKAERDLVSWLKKQSPEKARRAAKALQLTRVGHLKRLAAELKLKAVFDWIDSFLEDTDEKIGIYGTHKSILKPIRDRYKKISVLINGSVTKDKRKRAVDKFQNHDKTRIMVGNMLAAGVGLNLTAASTAAIIELGWTPAEHIQAEDRHHRIGQENPVTAYYLIAKGTIEEKLCKIIHKKAKVTGSILDGEGEGKYDDLSVFDELLRKLRR